MKNIFNLWAYLIKPHTKIAGDDERSRAKFFSALMLILSSVFTVYIAAISIFVTVGNDIIYDLIVAGVLWCIYALSRTRYHTSSILLFIVVICALLFAFVAMDVDEAAATTIYYFVIPVIVAGVMFPIRSFVTISGLIVLAMVIFAMIDPYAESHQIVSYTVNTSFIIIISTIFLAYRTHLDKKHLLELQEKEELYRTLIQSTKDGIWEWNYKTETAFYSPRYMEMIGYEPNEFSHNEEEWVKRIHPDDRQATLNLTVPCMEGRSDGFVTEYRFQHKDGSWRWILDRGFVLKDADGQAHRFFGMHTDITEHRQLEKNRLQLALERERMQLLNHFISHVSHEFRTPLSVINSSAYLLSRMDDFERKVDYLRRIEDQVSHISELVRMLTYMSVLDTIHSLADDSVAISQLLNHAVERKMSVFANKNIQVKTVLNTDSQTVFGNTEYLLQAFEMLLDNVIQYTPDGGCVTIEAQRQETHVDLKISDTGIGISKDDLPHIFERFYRVDKMGTTRGFGLGLAIVKRIIELHHGTIEIKSEVGKGTTCYISLPCSEMNEFQEAV